MSHLDFDEEGKETLPMKDDEFKLQLKRVIDAPFQKDKMIMIKSLYSNYKLTASQSAELIDTFTDHDKKLATAVILSEKLEENEEERIKFAKRCVKSCKWEEDKKIMAEMLDIEYEPPKAPEKKKGPKINKFAEGRSPI